MKIRSPVLLKLAEWYEGSAAGLHGGGKLNVQPAIEELLAEAGCGEGEARELAERDLRAAQATGVITLLAAHRREPDTIAKVLLAPTNEEAFFDYIGQPSPSKRRMEWAALFHEAATWPVPERFACAWNNFCIARAEAALCWRGMKPFERNDFVGGRELLTLLPRLLAWDGRHLVRWASSILCGQSKFLERRQRTIESLLAEATAGIAPSYESLGILPVPPGVTFHGPLRLRIGNEWRDFRGLHGSASLSGADVERITGCECEASRCLTVENATPYRSLAALHSGELLILTSYPNEATLGLIAHLKTLPSPPEFWHFGDTDPSGFHILTDLRKRSGIDVRSFSMRYRPSSAAPLLTARERALVLDLISKMPVERAALEAMLAAGNKGDFEQESLKPPNRSCWPFYDDPFLPEASASK
jgi:hypothetical protein